MKINLTKLKAKALAGTQHDWFQDREPIPGRDEKTISITIYQPDVEYFLSVRPEIVLGLIEDIEELKVALQFYSHKDEWSTAFSLWPKNSIYYEDDGETAQKALSEMKTECTK